MQPQEQVQQAEPPNAQPPGDVETLIGTVGDGLTQLMDYFEKGGADDGAKQELSALVSGFQSLVQKLNSPEQAQPPPAVGNMAENQADNSEKFNG